MPPKGRKRAAAEAAAVAEPKVAKASKAESDEGDSAPVQKNPEKRGRGRPKLPEGARKTSAAGKKSPGKRGRPKKGTTKAKGTKEEQLVALWRQFSCLYDITPSTYRKTKLKDLAVKEIARQMDEPVEWVKKQMRLLMSRYHNALISYPAVQCWLFDKLKFIEPFILQGGWRTNQRYSYRREALIQKTEVSDNDYISEGEITNHDSSFSVEDFNNSQDNTGSSVDGQRDTFHQDPCMWQTEDDNTDDNNNDNYYDDGDISFGPVTNNVNVTQGHYEINGGVDPSLYQDSSHWGTTTNNSQRKDYSTEIAVSSSSGTNIELLSQYDHSSTEHMVMPAPNIPNTSTPSNISRFGSKTSQAMSVASTDGHQVNSSTDQRSVSIYYMDSEFVSNSNERTQSSQTKSQLSQTNLDFELTNLTIQTVHENPADGRPSEDEQEEVNPQPSASEVCVKLEPSDPFTQLKQLPHVHETTENQAAMPSGKGRGRPKKAAAVESAEEEEEENAEAQSDEEQ